MGVLPPYIMVLGIGALASLGLALPTGMAFGYGYGYGVRAGYSAFRPPSKGVQGLKMSANPVTGALGAGLQSAEERTGVVAGIPIMKTPQGVTGQEPSLANNADKFHLPPNRERLYSKSGKYSITREQKNRMSRDEFRQWYNESTYKPRNKR